MATVKVEWWSPVYDRFEDIMEAWRERERERERERDFIIVFGGHIRIWNKKYYISHNTCEIE